MRVEGKMSARTHEPRELQATSACSVFYSRFQHVARQVFFNSRYFETVKCFLKCLFLSQPLQDNVTYLQW